MIDFNYTAPELLPFRIQEVLDAPNEPHRIGGVVYVPEGDGEYETCHGESDLSEWVCSECQCWIPLGLTPENIGHASEWRYCPHCGREIKAVKR